MQMLHSYHNIHSIHRLVRLSEIPIEYSVHIVMYNVIAYIEVKHQLHCMYA